MTARALKRLCTLENLASTAASKRQLGQTSRELGGGYWNNNDFGPALAGLSSNRYHP